MKDLYRLLPEEMEKMVMELGQPRFRADQILYPIYNKFPNDISEILQLPKSLRDKLIVEGYTIGSAKEVNRIVSEDGDTTKILLNLVDGNPIETVLI